MEKNETNTTQEQEINYISDYLESQMLQLPLDNTEKERRICIAGMIDALFDFGQMTIDTRDFLYPLYAF